MNNLTINLLKALEMQGKKRQSIPVLKMVRSYDNTLRVTDLDQVLSVTLPEGNTTFKHNQLYQAAGLSIAPQESDSDPDDFPTMDMNGGTEAVRMTVPTARFIKELEYVFLAASTEETRYFLNGICFGDQELVATDGYMLNRSPFGYGGSFYDAIHGGIIPSDTIKNVLRLGKALLKEDKNNQLTLHAHPDCPRMMFSFTPVRGHEVNVLTKLVDGKFPEYQRAIPAENRTQYVGMFHVKHLRALKPLVGMMPTRTKHVLINPDGTLGLADKTINTSTWDSLIQQPVVQVENISLRQSSYNYDYLLKAMKGMVRPEYHQNTLGVSPCNIICEETGRKATILPIRY